MPNTKLRNCEITNLRGYAGSLVSLYVAYAESGFPLTHKQIQDVLLDADQQHALSRVVELGFHNEYCYPEVTLSAPKCKAGTYEISRGVALRIRSTLKFSTISNTMYYGMSYDRFITERCGGGFPTLTDTTIGAENMAKLAKWVEAAVRARRLAAMTLAAVDTVLPHVRTTAHALQRWPVLGALAPESTYLRDRFRATGKPSQRYDWSTPDEIEARDRYAKLRQAAEVVLTSALMLPPLPNDAPDGSVNAFVSCHEILSGDKVWD